MEQIYWINNTLKYQALAAIIFLQNVCFLKHLIIKRYLDFFAALQKISAFSISTLFHYNKYQCFSSSVYFKIQINQSKYPLKEAVSWALPRKKLLSAKMLCSILSFDIISLPQRMFLAYRAFRILHEKKVFLVSCVYFKYSEVYFTKSCS